MDKNSRHGAAYRASQAGFIPLLTKLVANQKGGLYAHQFDIPNSRFDYGVRSTCAMRGNGAKPTTIRRPRATWSLRGGTYQLSPNQHEQRQSAGLFYGLVSC